MLTKISLLAFSALLILGCSKDSDSPNTDGTNEGPGTLPTVVTQSVALQNGTTFLCTGSVTAWGNAGAVDYGFCASTNPVPQLSEHHVQGSLQGDHYTVSYTGLNPTTVYYFRAWATNDAGTTFGSVISYPADPTVQDTAPCTPTMNSVVLGGGLQPENYYPGQIFPVEQAMFTWTFQANTSAHHFTYTFGSELTTGTFTTTVNSSVEPGKVRIGFFSGFTSGTMLDGSTVYVKELSPTQWEITVCQAPWGTGTKKLTTRFVVSS